MLCNMYKELTVEEKLLIKHVSEFVGVSGISGDKVWIVEGDYGISPHDALRLAKTGIKPDIDTERFLKSIGLFQQSLFYRNGGYADILDVTKAEWRWAIHNGYTYDHNYFDTLEWLTRQSAKLIGDRFRFMIPLSNKNNLEADYLNSAIVMIKDAPAYIPPTFRQHALPVLRLINDADLRAMFSWPVFDAYRGRGFEH